MRVIAVTNQKGGVGKTSVAVGLTRALTGILQQSGGGRCLLIDADDQGHATDSLGLTDAYNLADGPNLLTCLTRGTPLSGVIRPHPAGFDVAPSHYTMPLANQKLQPMRHREHQLERLVGELVGYDWVVIDSGPSFDTVTDNVLLAARDGLVIPVQAESSSVRALELLLDQITSVEEGLRVQVKILALVPNLVLDSSLSRKIIGQLREYVPVVTPFVIPKRVVLQYAWDKQVTIYDYQPVNRDQAEAKAEVIALFDQLAQLVIERVEERNHE